MLHLSCPESQVWLVGLNTELKLTKIIHTPLFFEHLTYGTNFSLMIVFNILQWWKRIQSIKKSTFADCLKTHIKTHTSANRPQQEGYSFLRWLQCLLGNSSTDCICNTVQQGTQICIWNCISITNSHVLLY
jgi:hypothetical protein